MSHWQHFRLAEFDCSCGRCSNGMQSHFISRLDGLRDVLGFPLIVTSGFRCEAHDQKIGGAGVHPSGLAADIHVFAEKQDRLVRAAVNLGFRGIGIKAKGAWPGRFVHLDDLESDTHPRPRIWTY